ncbi:MAG TPA: ATP-binding protein [Actinomycetota bacterium]|nr:ATP-binding protein [Actinomycetota bacterium]
MEHRLPYSTTAAGEAREIVRNFLPGRLDEDRVTEFMVMLSEVVGNAVRHGQPEADGGIGLRLDSENELVRAVVTDAGPECIFYRGTFERANLNHIGLSMVDGLADRWGVFLEGKKAVWFEMDVKPPAQER